MAWRLRRRAPPHPLIQNRIQNSRVSCSFYSSAARRRSGWRRPLNGAKDLHDRGRAVPRRRAPAPRHARVVCRLRPPRDGDCDPEEPTPLVFTSGAVYSFDEGEFSGPRDSAYGRFDAVLGTRATQDECYNACCAGLIDGCVRGVSATVLAYGASGAGKTHSLVGAVGDGPPPLPPSPAARPAAAAPVARARARAPRDDAALGVVPAGRGPRRRARRAARAGPGGERAARTAAPSRRTSCRSAPGTCSTCSSRAGRPGRAAATPGRVRGPASRGCAAAARHDGALGAPRPRADARAFAARAARVPGRRRARRLLPARQGAVVAQRRRLGARGRARVALFVDLRGAQRRRHRRPARAAACCSRAARPPPTARPARRRRATRARRGDPHAPRGRRPRAARSRSGSAAARGPDRPRRAAAGASAARFARALLWVLRRARARARARACCSAARPTRRACADAALRRGCATRRRLRSAARRRAPPRVEFVDGAFATARAGAPTRRRRRALARLARALDSLAAELGARRPRRRPPRAARLRRILRRRLHRRAASRGSRRAARRRAARRADRRRETVKRLQFASPLRAGREVRPARAAAARRVGAWRRAAPSGASALRAEGHRAAAAPRVRLACAARARALTAAARDDRDARAGARARPS